MRPATERPLGRGPRSVDGSVRLVRVATPQDVLQAMATRAGNEVLANED